MKFKPFFCYLFYVLLAVLIMLPFYKPGFVMLLDMPWSPHLDLTDSLQKGVQSTFPIMLFLKAVNMLFPMDVIEKILLTFVLCFPGLTMFHLVKQKLALKWAFLAGLFYMLNPFVYERLLAGHWFVLLGYGYLPFIITHLLKLLEKNNVKNVFLFSFFFSLYPVLSQHYAYISVFILFSILLVHIVQSRKLADSFTKRKKELLIAGIIFFSFLFIINSFWLLDIQRPDSRLNTIDRSDLPLYATLPDRQFGVFFTTLSLYGFWQADYLTPKDANPYWWIITLFIVFFSLVGAISVWRKKDPLGRALLFLFLPIWILAVGYESPLIRPVTEFLFTYFPGYKGLRESEKLVGILAFSYAYLMPFGAQTLLIHAHKYLFKPMTFFLPYFVAGFLFFIPFGATFTIFNGFFGQVQVSDYPKGWYIVNNILLNTCVPPKNCKALFIPWEGYPNLVFAQKRIIANPAQGFFDIPIVSSKSVDNPLKQDQTSKLDQKIFEIVQGVQSFDQEIPYFKSLGLTQVIIAKTGDYTRYEAFQKSQETERVFEDDSIILLRLK